MEKIACEYPACQTAETSSPYFMYPFFEFFIKMSTFATTMGVSAGAAGVGVWRVAGAGGAEGATAGFFGWRRGVTASDDVGRGRRCVIVNVYSVTLAI